MQERHGKKSYYDEPSGEPKSEKVFVEEAAKINFKAHWSLVIAY
jgi:hypothetical protein